MGDPVDQVRGKLSAIYQVPKYQEYQIVLPGKWLKKAYDPEMANYGEWYFTFSKNVSNQRDGISSVSLYFIKNRLSKIRHKYSEYEVVYD